MVDLVVDGEVDVEGDAEVEEGDLVGDVGAAVEEEGAAKALPAALAPWAPRSG